MVFVKRLAPREQGNFRPSRTRFRCPTGGARVEEIARLLLALAAGARRPGSGEAARRRRPPRGFPRSRRASRSRSPTSRSIVTDSKGKRVPGLTKDDFQVLQDGVPQTITNFYAVSGGELLLEDGKTVSLESRRRAAKTEVPEELQARYVVYIDNLNISAAEPQSDVQTAEGVRRPDGRQAGRGDGRGLQPIAEGAPPDSPRTPPRSSTCSSRSRGRRAARRSQVGERKDALQRINDAQTAGAGRDDRAPVRAVVPQRPRVHRGRHQDDHQRPRGGRRAERSSSTSRMAFRRPSVSSSTTPSSRNSARAPILSEAVRVRHEQPLPRHRPGGQRSGRHDLGPRRLGLSDGRSGDRGEPDDGHPPLQLRDAHQHAGAASDDGGADRRTRGDQHERLEGESRQPRAPTSPTSTRSATARSAPPSTRRTRSR